MSDFGGPSILKNIHDLRGLLSEFRARESALNQACQANLARLRQRAQQEKAQLQGNLAERLRETETLYAEAKDRSSSLHAARRARLSSAEKTSLKLALAKIEDLEGKRKHKLQTDTLRNQRSHSQGLTGAESAYKTFHEDLAVEHEKLGLLEERARIALKGYRKFSAFLSREVPVENTSSRDEHALLIEIRQLLEQIRTDIQRWERLLIPRFFRYLPLWIIVLGFQFALVPILRSFGITDFTYQHATYSTIGFMLVGMLLYFVGQKKLGGRAQLLAEHLAACRHFYNACLEKSETRRTETIERVENEFQTTGARIQQEWTETVETAERSREATPAWLQGKATRARSTNDTLLNRKLEWLVAEQVGTLTRLQSEPEVQQRDILAALEMQESATRQKLEQELAHLKSEWAAKSAPIWSVLERAQSHAKSHFGSWDEKGWQDWKPPTHAAESALFARVSLQAEWSFPKTVLDMPALAPYSPVFVSFPAAGSLVFEADRPARSEALSSMNNLILRILTSVPPGRAAFTVYDPVGLGQNFSGITHLSDQAEHLIHGRIWTQAAQIDEKLMELTEHMEKVIQMYLRNEYATIAEYNLQAGSIAEKYHFLVIADFPASMSENSLRRLQSILQSGPRCGVFTILHWDKPQGLPTDFSADLLRKHALNVISKNKDWTLHVSGASSLDTVVQLESPPPGPLLTDLIQSIGLASKDSNRVQLPYSQIAPKDHEWWSLGTASELRVAVGRTGATKLQYLELGRETRQHALVSGQTGSGKSTLFHVIVTNLAAWCSPDEVQFYLIDFKKGVEFKCYATHRLPHARVIGIESDREFGVSVLQRLDEELKRRGELFRRAGVQDLPGYKRNGGTEPMPRVLLLIDEFQEFFVEDDKVAQTASLLLDRIVRQGRAFGIHALLGSQTLGGVYSMARATLGQMAVRIALQCNEADAYLIMDDNNPAPRLLSRPGEGIYNDTAGTVEGNSPFQVVWLSDDVRDQVLRKTRTMAEAQARSYPPPIVFEGNVPADVQEDLVVRQALETGPTEAPLRFWLGAANSIKGPTEVVFNRQSGNNLLIVGQREEAILAELSISLLTLAAQRAPENLELLLLDGSQPGTPARAYIDQLQSTLGTTLTVSKLSDFARQLTTLMGELAGDDQESFPKKSTILFIHGIQKFTKLRFEEDFGFGGGDAAPSLGSQLNRLITEGPRQGIHVVVVCDNYNTVNRFLSRKALTEFELRVLFQMSANDSASLVDSPKASTLGLNKALFFNQQEGHMETFRPYALPPLEWIGEIREGAAAKAAAQEARRSHSA